MDVKVTQLSLFDFNVEDVNSLDELLKENELVFSEFKNSTFSICELTELESLVEEKSTGSAKVQTQSQKINDEPIFSFKHLFNSFAGEEQFRDTAGVIEQLKHKKFTLTEKIRTNKEIAAFISNLFNKRNVSPNIDYLNIHLQYFDSAGACQDYLNQLSKED